MFGHARTYIISRRGVEGVHRTSMSRSSQALCNRGRLLETQAAATASLVSDVSDIDVRETMHESILNIDPFSCVCT